MTIKQKPGNNPCYLCEDREIGCHATCQKYIDWKEEKQEYADKLNEIKEKEKQHQEYIKHTIEKNRRYKNRR